jgi:hypothetical protein
MGGGLFGLGLMPVFKDDSNFVQEEVGSQQRGGSNGEDDPKSTYPKSKLIHRVQSQLFRIGSVR